MFYPVVLCVWRWEWGTVLFATAQQFQFPQCTMNCVSMCCKYYLKLEV